MATTKLTPEKKAIIKNLRKEAQKSVNKIFAEVFDTKLRNEAFIRINELLEAKIQEVKNL